MKKCECGRCKHEIPVVSLVTDPDDKSEFLRTTCMDCGQWIGDQLTPPKEA